MCWAFDIVWRLYALFRRMKLNTIIAISTDNGLRLRAKIIVIPNISTIGASLGHGRQPPECRLQTILAQTGRRFNGGFVLDSGDVADMAVERVEGLRELERALKELPKSTGKNVLRRGLRKRAQPLADAAGANAPVGETGRLAASVTVGTRLSRRQARLHRREAGGGARMTAEGWRSDPKEDVFVFVGFPSTPKSIVQEFGSADQSPQPYMRPAWDAEHRGILEGLRADLWTEIDKAAKRLARKQARLAARG